jgi:hypothetical protein
VSIALLDELLVGPLQRTDTSPAEELVLGSFRPAAEAIVRDKLAA